MIPREIIVGKLPTGKYFNQRYDTDKLPDKDRGKYLIKDMILTKIVVPAGPVAATWAAISVSFVYRGFEFHTQFDLMH